MSLVLNRGDSTLGSPVDGVSKIGFVKFNNVQFSFLTLVTWEVFSLEFLMRHISELIDTKVIWVVTRSVEVLDESKVLIEHSESAFMFLNTFIFSVKFGFESLEGIDNVVGDGRSRDEIHFLFLSIG